MSLLTSGNPSNYIYTHKESFNTFSERRFAWIWANCYLKDVPDASQWKCMCTEMWPCCKGGQRWSQDGIFLSGLQAPHIIHTEAFDWSNFIYLENLSALSTFIFPHIPSSTWTDTRHKTQLNLSPEDTFLIFHRICHHEIKKCVFRLNSFLYSQHFILSF